MKAIVILLDTLNRRMLEAYHDQTWVKTPNMTRLAKRSVIFDQHWAGSLPCMPARRDILTGRLSFLERGWGGLEPFDETLPQKLQRGMFFHISLLTIIIISQQVESITYSRLIRGTFTAVRKRIRGPHS